MHPIKLERVILTMLNNNTIFKKLKTIIFY